MFASFFLRDVYSRRRLIFWNALWGVFSWLFVSFFLARRGFPINVLGAGLFWKEWTARCFAGRFAVRRHAVVSLASHGS